jgi:hypothetical protein
LATKKQYNMHKREKNNSDTLQVFVMPMTHVDPGRSNNLEVIWALGWLKTFDEYSVDTNSILDNMLSFMKTRPQMRFTWCEIAFFERWWTKQNDSAKEDIRR